MGRTGETLPVILIIGMYTCVMIVFHSGEGSVDLNWNGLQDNPLHMNLLIMSSGMQRG